MVSADQVPLKPSSIIAPTEPRAVLILRPRSDLHQLIAPRTIRSAAISLGRRRSVGLFAGEHRPDDPCGFVSHRHSDHPCQVPLEQGADPGRSRQIAGSDRRITAVAPTTRSLRRYPSLFLEIRPSLSFPPEEFCRGTRPRKAANSRPERNSDESVTVKPQFAKRARKSRERRPSWFGGSLNHWHFLPAKGSNCPKIACEKFT